MILPTIRASLSRSDAQQLVHLLGSGLPGMGYVSLVEAPRDERTSLQTPSQPRTVLCWQDPPVPGPPLPGRGSAAAYRHCSAHPIILGRLGEHF